jgi:hypothetical protein
LGGYWPRCTAVLGSVADKKLYLYTNEHSPGPTLWAGGKLRCIDADNGTEIWKISFWGNAPIVADGYLVDLNSYDNQIYCFGKGQTAIELSAMPKVVSKGSSILIEGKVTDQSPAVKGAPAVADEDMSAWMEYLVMQKNAPQTVGGVNVELYAIDETGKASYIDTVCTDPLNGGIFRKLWTPPKEGTYTITAVFAGSKSYWDSYTSTAIGVTEAPTPSATAEQAGTLQSNLEALQNTVQAQQPLITALMVLVVIAIVIGIVNLYALRKKK